MNNELFIKIVSAVITVILALVTSVLIPWIKSKMTAEQMDLLERYTEYAVRCAEQIYTPDEWKTKKEFVVNYITEILNDKFKLSLTDEDVNTLVEGIVNEVKK